MHQLGCVDCCYEQGLMVWEPCVGLGPLPDHSLLGRTP